MCFRSFVSCFDLAIEKLLFGMLSVIVEPAAIKTFSPILRGATRVELHPIKTLSLIFVSFFLLPSKLAVITPQPILQFFPICVSPKYAR